jgi:hypothetical protein
MTVMIWRGAIGEAGRPGGGWCRQTVPVHEPPDTIVAQALARRRAEDKRLGVTAEAALNSLTWDEGLETITQYGLQRFLWYELPRKWMTDLEGKRHLARALGRLLHLVGLPRHAAICHSPETDAVLAASERDDREGFAAFRRAEERSGLHPPDLPELTWGPVMGMREAGAFWSVAAALELAVAGGELRPGSRGWRAAQQAIAHRHLATARPELDGWTWLEAVLAERVQEWARSRGQARQALVEPLLARLRSGPVEVPAGAAETVAPLRWLLARAGEGIALTQKGNLARLVVVEAVERFGWQPLPNPPRGEDDVFELWVLRDLARDLSAVRRSGRRLVATRTGRTLAGDAEALWRAVAGRLGGGDDFGAIVTELALARLLDAGEVLQAALVKRVHVAVVGESWHDRVTGELPDLQAVRRQLAEPLRLLGVLGLSREGGDWQARTVALTGVGRATAVEALRARATGPRPDPFRG